MAWTRVRRARLLAVASALLVGAVSVVDFSPAEARMGGFHGGARVGFGARGFRGVLHGGFGHGFHHGLRGHGFHHRVIHHVAVHPIHRHVFVFHAGLGGVLALYPVASPYPAYYPYDYRYYWPCGYYDAYGRWINVACPPYSPAAVVAPGSQLAEGGQGTQAPGY